MKNGEQVVPGSLAAQALVVPHMRVFRIGSSDTAHMSHQECVQAMEVQAQAAALTLVVSNRPDTAGYQAFSQNRSPVASTPQTHSFEGQASTATPTVLFSFAEPQGLTGTAAAAAQFTFDDPAPRVVPKNPDDFFRFTAPAADNYESTRSGDSGVTLTDKYTFAQPVYGAFVPRYSLFPYHLFRLYVVVSLHMCVLPYKYRNILEMLLKLMKFCDITGHV